MIITMRHLLYIPVSLLLLASTTACEYKPRMHMDIPRMQPLKIQLIGSHTGSDEVWFSEAESSESHDQLLFQGAVSGGDTLDSERPSPGIRGVAETSSLAMIDGGSIGRLLR